MYDAITAGCGQHPDQPQISSLCSACEEGARDADPQVDVGSARRCPPLSWSRRPAKDKEKTRASRDGTLTGAVTRLPRQWTATTAAERPRRRTARRWRAADFLVARAGTIPAAHLVNPASSTPAGRTACQGSECAKNEDCPRGLFCRVVARTHAARLGADACWATDSSALPAIPTTRRSLRLVRRWVALRARWLRADVRGERVP